MFLTSTIVFYLFATAMLGCASGVILSRNPVHSALWLMLTFFQSAGLFLLLGAEFIAMVMVIVYVGAVAVLFLFVVMMLDVQVSAMRAGFMKHIRMGVLVASILLGELWLVVSVHVPQPELPDETIQQVSNTRAIGNVLYTDYIFPFQLSGLILLLAMVGTITLTLRKRPHVKHQDINQQLARDPRQAVELVKVKTGQGVGR